MIYPEIVAGEAVASRLKEVYFKDEAWSPKIASKIGGMLTILKKVAAPFYPLLDRIGVLHELARYDRQDFDEAFSSSLSRTVVVEGSVGAKAMALLEEK